MAKKQSTVEEQAEEAFGAVEDDESEDDLLVVGGLDEVDGKYLVPDHDWEARTLEVKKEISKSGKPMLTFSVALTGQVLTVDGYMDSHSESDKHSGKEFNTWVSLVPAALFKVKEMAEALDIPIENGRLRCKLSDLVNRRFIARMKSSEYEGRESSKVDRWIRHPDGPDL
jgi:hypothetical protein